MSTIKSDQRAKRHKAGSYCRSLVLDKEDADCIKAFLNSPPPPTERMKSIAAHYHDSKSWIWYRN